MNVKRPLLVALLGLGVLSGLLMLAYFTVSDARLIGWLVQRVESSAGVRIRYDSAQLHRGLTPMLDVTQLKISADDGHYHIGTTSLQLSVSLPYLLLARLDIPSLQIGDTQVTLQAHKAPPVAESFDIAAVLDALHFKPVLHELRIANVAVSTEGAEWQLPASRVSEISLQLSADEETSLLAADVNRDAEKLHVEVTLPGLRDALASKHLPFSVKVNGIYTDGELNGVLDFSDADTTLQAELRVQVADLGWLPIAVEGMSIPGELYLEAGITGVLDQLAAEAVTARWQDAAGSAVQLQGRVGDVLGLSALDLKLTGALANAGWLKPVLPDSLGDIVRAKLSGAIGGSRDRLLISGLQLAATGSDALELHLSGEFELAAQEKYSYRAENIQAGLEFSAPTTRAARALLFEEIPELGALQASADIRSVTGDPVFDNISVQTRSETGIEAQLSGRIEQFPLDPDKPNRGYDLDVSIRAGQAQSFLRTVDLDLALDGPLHVQFEIQGDTPALQLNAIKLAAGNDQALRIDAAGDVLFGDWSRDDPLQSLDLLIDAGSRDSRILGRFAQTEVLPEMGALKLHGHLHTVAGKHRVDDFYLRTDKSAPVQVALTGSASDLTLFPAPLLAGLRLDFVGQGDDTAALNALFDLAPPWIPPVGGFKVTSTLTGGNKSVNITDTRIDAGSKAMLAVAVNGRLGKLDAESGWSLYNTSLKLEAQSDSSQALLQVWGYHLPPLGPLSATAEIRDEDGTLGLNDLHLGVGKQQDDEVFVARGRIGDLTRVRNVDIDAQLNIDGHNLAAFADRHSLQDLSPLTGHLHIGDKNGVLGMQTLVLNSDHETLSIDINGKFTDFSKPETLSLNAKVKARDLALVGALFDQDWPELSPFTLQAVVEHDSSRRTRLRANLGAAKKTLDADLLGDFNSKPPRISGKLMAQQIAVPDFYAKAAKQREEGKKGKKEAPPAVFSREPIAFERLKAFDLDLDVNVASFDQDVSVAESAAMKVKLESGLLRIHPAVVNYPSGILDLDLLVDARQQPRLSFSARGDTTNPLEAMGKEAKAAIDLRADYKIDIQLSASGDSPHALASSLQGGVFLNVRRARIRSSLLSYLFVDIVGWATDRVRNKKFSPVNCGVVDFSVKQGVINTYAFFLDLEDIAITGEGDVDLGKETVQYVFLPKKKSRIIRSADPVKVKGALADPKVTAIPVKSALLNFGTLIFAPYVFAGLTASDYVGQKLHRDKGDSPCLNYKKANDTITPNTELPQTTD